MSSRQKSRTSWKRETARSTISVNENFRDGSLSIKNIFLRFTLFLILICFVLPVALLLTPWWIFFQPFSFLCPTIFSGYTQIVTWPLTLMKNIRFIEKQKSFTDYLHFWIPRIKVKLITVVLVISQDNFGSFLFIETKRFISDRSRWNLPGKSVRQRSVRRVQFYNSKFMWNGMFGR